VTGADGGYMVVGERYLPEVAFVPRTRHAHLPDLLYCPFPPDLAVEVLSPSDDPRDIRLKIANYLTAGVMVWVVDPEQKRVEVYVPGHTAKTVYLDGSLEGEQCGPALPWLSKTFSQSEFYLKTVDEMQTLCYTA